ncbi:proton-conducting transporter membrane subunit [Maricaulis maris]|uniref:proton-conducting transporter transmembrane domain-containing protein n=1 Tax=Maricaulis maris TaxID=74318 RepID=UPI00291FF8AA|nr:NADH dehydrogenase [Maricaulis maris]
MPLTASYALFIAPAALTLFSVAAILSSGPRPFVRHLVPVAALLTVACAVGALVILLSIGSHSANLGVLSARIDPVSVTLFVLVAVIGSLVLGFSRTFLDGENRQGPFLGWMGATLAGVLLLVMAGDLFTLLFAWIATSLTLRRLLLFYPDRPGAQRVARKQGWCALASDLALAGAVITLLLAFGTADIAQINTAAREGVGTYATLMAAALLALAAVLKSAQFPFHGWLTEVMEAPTPVSALLHAGVINGGGFLLIRFADLMLLAPSIMAVLVLLGGFTALFGGLVMLTQPAVKTSLAWSTISQMGFMILQCGLALFPLALLHIVAHSLYKAHAFLASGSAVSAILEVRRPGPIAVPKLHAVILAFIGGLLCYTLIGFLIGFEGKSPQAIALGAILVFGVSYLLAQGFADKAPRALAVYTVGYAVMTTLAYFSLQTLTEYALAGTLPPAPAIGPLQWALILLALISFGTIAIVQASFPLWSGHPAARGLRVHLSNGLYINALTDRWLRNWAVRRGR